MMASVTRFYMYILQHFLCSVNYTFLQMCLIFCIFPWCLGNFPKETQKITLVGGQQTRPKRANSLYCDFVFFTTESKSIPLQRTFSPTSLPAATKVTNTIYKSSSLRPSYNKKPALFNHRFNNPGFL